MNFIMAKFYYKLLNKDSRIEEGTVSALTKGGSKKKLAKEGSTLIFIIPEKLSLLKKNISLPIFGFKPAEKINFFRNLAAMNSAGVSMTEALEILSEQVKSKKLSRAILDIAENVRNGQRLSKAMAEYPRYFSDFMVETVNMGDLSGRLTDTLERISIDLEKDDELKKKVKGALAYPSVIVVLMLIIAIGLIIFVLPDIEKLFLEMEVPLPLVTKAFLSLGRFITMNPIVLSLALIGLIIFFIFLYRSKKGHYFFNSLSLKVPIMGPLIRDYNLVLFFRSMESLIKSGISIVHAAEVAGKTVTNDVYKKAVQSIHPILLYGVPFTDTLKPFPHLFPVQTQKIIKVGEKAGQMEKTLRKTTEYYEKLVDYKTRMMTVLIEPILMVILGLVVAALALSIFLPIYQLASVM